MGVIPAIDLDPGDSPASIGYAPLSGMQVDPAGHITYNFDGRVHAAGLDLDAAVLASPTGNPPDERKVRWLSTVDGAAVAELSAYELNPGGPASSTGLNMTTSRGAHTAGILATANPGGGSFDHVAAVVNNTQLILLDGRGVSGQVTFAKGGSGSVGGGVNLWAGVTVHLDIPTDNLLVVVSASGYVTVAGSVAAWNLLFDGVVIGSSSFLFNEAAEHHELGLTIGRKLFVLAGDHTIQLSNPSSPLAVDGNDNCAWLVIG